jgi:rare lipoprotein A
MAKRRHSSVNAAPPASRRPWALGGAALALLVYGGAVVSDAGRPAPTPPPRVAAMPSSTLPLAGVASLGRASWYGAQFQGSPTASGEPFDMHGLTAAHRTLPLGSYARVRNLDNGRAVVVRINDRGPHARRRMIDLSYAAAQEIEMLGSGTARVEVSPLAP